MTDLPSRRNFLALTSAGTTAALAGCSQFDSLTQSDEADGESADAVTVAVSPDESELQSLSEEIQSKMESGDLDQLEAREKYQKQQRELTEAAASDFEETAANEDLTIEESKTQYGLFRVTGSDEVIMDALRNGDLVGIYPSDQYEAFLQQQRQREQQQQQQRALLEQQQQQESQDDGDETADSNDSEGADESNDSDAGNETAE
ncbi:hypothetical protein [Halopiger djelfimassiliensis]|uniref:hypothetical protein n=1 Tax=Halopiger djelfimassiliensis TaxID=1293047 RepID=UPI000677F290|nr:hypothetical protein [Halopiger djelfimassiliensis]